MKKVLFIVSFFDFDKRIFEISKKYFISKKFEVLVAAKCDVLRIENDLSLKIDFDLNKTNLNLSDYSGIFFISKTNSSKNCLNDPQINEIILDSAKKNIYVGDIDFNTKVEIEGYLNSIVDLILK